MRVDKKNRQASILMASMWLLILFTILAVAIYKMFSSQIAMSKRLQEMSLAYFMARAAVIDAQKDLYFNEKNYTSLSQLKVLREQEMNHGSFSYYFIDEESKLNINRATEEMLSSIPGIDSRLAQDISTSSLRPFTSIEELFRFDGLDPDDYLSFKDFLTVFGDGRINVNTASREAFSFLGINESTINKIFSFRDGPDGVELTEDDGVFESQSDIIPVLRDSFFLSLSEEEFLVSLLSAQRLDVKSQYYTLILNIKFLEKIIGKYAITITKEAIVQWREF